MDLELLSVSKRYGAQVALDRVSLQVRGGDCYGFLGHNGAGKTTALRIALGLIRPGAGRVVVDGFDAARHPREARARMGGLVEVPAFYDGLSGRANLMVLAELGGMSRGQAAREADRLLEAVALGAAGVRRAGAYSQGMRQRLGIAQALIGDPRIILLDEPTNGLDPEGIEAVRRLLHQLTRDEGRAVLLSSHQLHEVTGLCNRVGILRQGKMLIEEETDRLLAGAGARVRLRTDRNDAARRALEEHGVQVEPGPDDSLLVEARPLAPPAIARVLIERGLELRELAPAAASLEEIYLRLTRQAPASAEPAGPPRCPVVAPAPRRACAHPVARMLRAELRVSLSRAGTWLALLLPAVMGALAVVRLYARAQGHLAEVEGGTLIGTSQVTAFEAVAVALQTGLPLAAFIAAGLASQSVAGELARRTLRNLALRPVTRWQLAFGKALGALGAALICYALLCLAGFAASALAFDFGDVVEIMEIRAAEPWVLVPAQALRPVLARTVPLLAAPLAAATALGFLAGALTARNSLALGLSAGLLLLVDLARELGRVFGFERWLLSAYLPSPLRDTSYAARLLGLIRAPNDAPPGFPESALWVPLLWLLACLALAGLALERRSIP